MERQDTLRNLLIAAGVFMLIWVVGEKFLFPPRPRPPLPAQQVAERTPHDESADPSAVAHPPSATGAQTSGTAPGAGQPVAGSRYSMAEAPEVQTWAFGSDALEQWPQKGAESPFRMRLVVSNVGASVESALLTDHAERLRDPTRYALLGAFTDDRGVVHRSLAVEKINLDEIDLPLAGKRWHASAQGVTEYTDGDESGRQIEFYIDILKDESPAVRLTRTYRLPRQPRESGRHDLFVTLGVQNLSTETQRALVTFRGGVGIRAANPSRDDRVVDVGIRSAEGLVSGKRRTFHDVAAKQTLVLSPGDPASRFSWASTANTYFTCILAPVDPNLTDPAGWLAQAAAVDLDGSPATLEDVTLRFSVRGEQLAAGQSVSYRTEIFAGENDGEAFRRLEPYKSRNYYFQIAQGFGWCTFTFLVELMIWLMNRTYSLIPNFGLSVIVLVLIVRVLLHPITKKGQVNMVRMQTQMGDLAPKLEEVKKKFANDKARMQQEIMRVYRESGVSPGGQLFTCLPMFIQMPIWIALYLSLSHNIRMRHEPFILWIRDLTAPDALWTFSSPIVVPLLGWELPSLNLLPILVSISMYLQTKFQPKPKPNPNMSDEQRMQQEMMMKMMPMMSVVMLILFYKMPSGLTLYITASNFLGMIEQWRIRKHIREREKSGTLLKPAKTPKPPKEIPSDVKLPRWAEWMQRKIQEAQKVDRTHRAKPRR